MVRAVWKDVVIAGSSATTVVEGNHDFPPDAARREYLAPSGTTGVCPWKGRAGYFDVVVDGEVEPDAAWTYLQPSAAAAEIVDHIAFSGGVDHAV